MAKKTVVRAAWKWLPISVEIMRRIEERDNTVVKGVDEHGMINVTPGYEGAEDEERTIEPPEDVIDATATPVQGDGQQEDLDL